MSSYSLGGFATLIGTALTTYCQISLQVILFSNTLPTQEECQGPKSTPPISTWPYQNPAQSKGAHASYIP